MEPCCYGINARSVGLTTMSKEPTHELVLRKEMHDALSTILASEQENNHPAALANQNPEKWMEAAAIIMMGGRPFDLRRKLGMFAGTANKLYGLISTTDEAKLFRKERASQLAYQTANTAELQDRIVENLLSDESEDAVRAMGPKELQQLALAQKLSHEQFERITGNNVQKIEVRHITTPEEAQSMIDSLPEADVEGVVDV